MSFDFASGSIDWSELSKNRKDWFMASIAGLIGGVLYNWFAYASYIFSDDTILIQIKFAFFILGATPNWLLGFGIAAGFFHNNFDFIEHLAITFILGFVFFTLASFLLPIVLISPGGIYFLNLITLCIVLPMGTGIGYGLRVFVNRHILKVQKREIENSDYVDYKELSWL